MSDLLYLRFSTAEQTADAQRADIPADVLARIGDGCTFTDPGVSGSVPALERDGFRALLLKAEPGDTIHVAWFDRLMRPEHMSDAEIVISTLRRKRLHLRAHDFPLPDLTDDNEMTEVVWKIMAALAGMERRRTARRRDAGMRAAREAGTHMGRPASYTPAQASAVVELDERDRSQRSIAREVGLSARTVGRILADHRAQQLGDQGDGSNPGAALAPHSPVQGGPVELAIPGRCVEDLRYGPRDTPAEVIEALKSGRKLARGASGYQLLVTATPEVHRLIRQWAPAVQDSNGRKARRKWDAALDAMPQAAVVPEQRHQDDDRVPADGPVPLPLAKAVLQSIQAQTDLSGPERAAVESATGRGTTVKVTAAPSVHRQLAQRARTVADSQSVRKYAAAVAALPAPAATPDGHNAA
ncbi:recombinase family protein [Kitasatospora sp. NPDC001309]|uniref:recombinase family protein n=1 Tax=Kitasatospora sp. NPDC001309 TaxID=3364013 RepID=UPI00369FB00E